MSIAGRHQVTPAGSFINMSIADRHQVIPAEAAPGAVPQQGFHLFKVFHARLEDLLIFLAENILVEISADSFRMAHLAEYSSIR